VPRQIVPRAAPGGAALSPGRAWQLGAQLHDARLCHHWDHNRDDRRQVIYLKFAVVRRFNIQQHSVQSTKLGRLWRV
jgi:hypothetical protein